MLLLTISSPPEQTDACSPPSATTAELPETSFVYTEADAALITPPPPLAPLFPLIELP